MSDAPKSKQEKLAEKTASVIVGKDVDITKPLNARSIARDANRRRSSLAGAFALAGITGVKNAVEEVTSTYILPHDSVLLMIGNTDELVAVCKLANETDPRINLIRTENYKDMQLRYARIQVSKGVLGKGGQTDTLIALGATLPATSANGWREEVGQFLLKDSVTTEDKNLTENAGSLPGHIKLIKLKDDSKKWIDAHA
jgi:hypothetical protein